MSVALFAGGNPDLAYGAFALAFTVFCFATTLSLNWQILGGTALGLAAGVYFGEASEAMALVGRLFISMLKMLIAPMILLSIVHGIGSMSGARELGRLGSRTVALYVLTMALAVLTGLVLVNLVQPGAGSTPVETELFTSATSGTAPAQLALGDSMVGLLLQSLTNPFTSLAEGRILPIVVFSILFGVALVQVGAPARPLVETLGSAYAAVMRIVSWFIRLAPVGVFALLGNLVATVGLDSTELVRDMGLFAGVVIGGTLFHAGITLPLVARIAGGVSPLVLFRGVREALIVAFTTSSSAATLPVTMRCVEQNLGVPPRVSSFVLPLGATVNMDGTALYEAIAAVFVANLYGIELGLGSQLVIFVIAMAAATGAPGIPSAGMATMVVVLEAVGLPVEAIGLLLTIERFLDTFRTMANVEGDAVVAVSVAHVERSPRRDEPD